MRRQLTIGLCAVLLATVATAGPGGVRRVQAAQAGATFNYPTGSASQQMAIMRKLINIIDATPRGAVIRIAVYSFTMTEFADALIAAYKRGVSVRLINDDHLPSLPWDRLRQRLGTNPRASSFAIECHMSCNTDIYPSYQHAKVYMFSSSGSTSSVVAVSSANPTYAQAEKGWNDLYTMVGNSTMYTAFRTYFEMLTAGAMTEGKQGEVKPDLYFTASSGRYKAYFFPKGGAGDDEDPIYEILRNVSCTGTASGYGSNGKTVVKVAIYQFSSGRIRLAEQLWKLDDQGCSVEILFDQTQMDRVVANTLRAPGGDYGGPVLIPAAHDGNGDGVVDWFLHNKYFLINGVYDGDRSSRIVFTGSQNWSSNSLRYNNETLLKVTSGAYGDYADHYARLKSWAKAQAAMTTSPAGSLLPSATTSDLELLPPPGE